MSVVSIKYIWERYATFQVHYGRINNVLVGAMRACGTVLWPAMLGMVSILGIELPFAYWLHSIVGISAIWWAYTVGFGAMLLLQSTYFNWRWRGQRIERLV